MLLDQWLKPGPCGVGCAPARAKEAPRSVARGQGGSCLIFSPIPHCHFLGEHIPPVVVCSSWESTVFLLSLPPTLHPMPGLMAGLGHKRLTGRTQEAGDSIYSLWSWGREKKRGKGWALSVFLPSPTHSKGFCPLGGVREHMALCAGGCRKMPQSSREDRAAGRGAKKTSSLVYVG